MDGSPEDSSYRPVSGEELKAAVQECREILEEATRIAGEQARAELAAQFLKVPEGAQGSLAVDMARVQLFFQGKGMRPYQAEKVSATLIEIDSIYSDVELLAVADDVSSLNNDPLALPASDGAQSVTVGGEAVAMEELGPIVINTDGTTARITNWPEMTPAEQEKTRRVIVARNAKRLAKLEAAREL